MADVMSMSDIQATAGRLNVDINSLDLDSICLPDGQDYYIISDDEDLKKEKEFEFEKGFGNMILVDNLSVVPKDKFEKLVGVILKIYSQIGLIKEDGIWMPVDPNTQKTLGYCCIEFNTPREAELAKETTHGYKLDRSHIFSVVMFDDIEKFLKVPEEWTPPEIKPYTPGENLQKWLTDEKARDQFVIRSDFDTEVWWNDARQSKPELVYKRPYWTETFVQWSPMGSYLATIHRQGAAVWGGSFDRLMRYKHPEVKLIDFSPGERFLVTCSSQEPINPRDTHRVLIRIFDVRTGKVMREFDGSADEFVVGGTGGVSLACFQVGWWTRRQVFCQNWKKCGLCL